MGIIADIPDLEVDISPLSGSTAAERYSFHQQLTRTYVSTSLLFVPLPGLAFLGLGYARPILWLNKVRKADDSLAFANKTAWNRYKTARAVSSVTGSVSVVGYYQDRYVQEAAWRLVNGQKPESVVAWMKDEHNVPHQKAVAILLQLHEERLEFISRGLEDTSRTGTEARSFYDMDGLSLLKSISTPTPTPGSFTIGQRKSRKRASARRRSRSDSSKPRAPQGWMKRSGPFCSVHKKSHWCKFTRKR